MKPFIATDNWYKKADEEENAEFECRGQSRMNNPICDKCKKEITTGTIYPRYRVMSGEDFKITRNYVGQVVGNGEYYLHPECEDERA